MTPTGRRCAALAGRGSCQLPETSRFVSRKRLITMWYLDAFVVLFYVVKISSLASALNTDVNGLLTVSNKLLPYSPSMCALMPS